MIGLVNLKTSVFEIAKNAIEDATYMCRRAHGDAPDVVVVGRTDLTFPYVPSHLNYMLLELLKNSMRATVETHGIDDMPPIKIVIADGEDNEDVSTCLNVYSCPSGDENPSATQHEYASYYTLYTLFQVVIKISDEGGGIKRSNMGRIWSYLYTTADPETLEAILNAAPPPNTPITAASVPADIAHHNLDERLSRAVQATTGGSASAGATPSSAGSNAAAHAKNPLRDFAVTASPLAGLGYGLPIARNYARYFGGELTIVSMEGYGTDGYIYLPRLGKSDASV